MEKQGLILCVLLRMQQLEHLFDDGKTVFSLRKGNLLCLCSLEKDFAVLPGLGFVLQKKTVDFSN